VAITLPETASQIKTRSSERLQHPLDALTQDDRGSDAQSLPADRPGSIVVRFSVCGHVGVEILAEESDEEERLLTAARPVLELLQGMFTVEPLTSPRSR
jgi:hypothetical protein